MKKTESKDLVKGNQILPIMQGYFGKSINQARIKLMASALAVPSVDKLMFRQFPIAESVQS